ncbi:hypothetical protein P7H41_12850 [Vagococcus fluvialis]|uniref:hypothetical protein n=1 Tax=Vagococcus fluvialis TaxID=2738 RepID=UPI00288DDB44|nr:hypothetical protein [Vagococcus fluvialis]MDT2782830.1 hypothetical protein [Vagococcus fluvialis]
MSVEIRDLIEQSSNLFGKEFIAIKGYSEVLDFETKELSAYKLRVLIASEDSPFYYENLEVKVKNLSPTISFKELENNKIVPVRLTEFSISEYKGKLYFSASDVTPILDNKISLNK